MATMFKFRDIKHIMDAFDEYWERMYVWEDTDGRRWAVIKGVLWSAPLERPNWLKKSDIDAIELQYTKPVCWGTVGGFQLYDCRKFDPKSKWSYKWEFSSGNLDHIVSIQPPYDCRSCKHLIYIDEEKCGLENGGIVCKKRWDEGDSYVCTDEYETKDHLCKDFEPDKYHIKELEKRGLI